MASSKEYLTFILEQLSDLEGISYRAMMGEYIIYYREKIVGGIYDDRLLVKPVKSAVSLMPNAIYELPYDGAKEMLLVDNVDNKDFLTRLFVAMYDELPAQKKKKSKNRNFTEWTEMNLELILMSENDIAEFKKNVQCAFQKGFEDVFGKCEETILPEKDIDQSLNGKAVIEQS